MPSNIGKTTMLKASKLGTLDQVSTDRNPEHRIASLQRRRAKNLDDVPGKRPPPRRTPRVVRP
jgi:hypothetical protein